MKYLLQTHPGPNPCSEASQSPQDLTPCPYSAVCSQNCCFSFPASQEHFVSDPYQVSSFNLPSYCDSTLITPITMSQSVAIGTKTAPAMRSDADIKLSPSIMSPTYYFLGGDNEYNGERYYDCLPMKHKSRSGDFHLSTLDSLFPASPYTCPEPYFGAYGVSATPTSEYSDSSPSLVRSPAQLSSTSGLSNYCNSSPSQSSLPTPVPEVTYRSQMRAPLLIAPNPSTLRSATKQDSGSYRQNSLQSISGTVVHALLPEPRLSRSLPIRSRKRKSPSRDESERNIELSGEMTENEELLIELSHKERRPWAEIQRIFNEKTNSNVSIATLQMRKTRLIKRIRVWTDEDVRKPTSYYFES